MTIKTINDLKPDPNNANRGTERGHRIVNNSIQRHGAGRSGLAARDGTMIAGSQTLEEMAALLQGARTVVGLDTGFTHLAAALGRPTLGIYCDHDPGLAGITGPGRVASIGGKGILPTRNEVMALLEQQIAGAASPQSTY